MQWDTITQVVKQTGIHKSRSLQLGPDGTRIHPAALSYRQTGCQTQSGRFDFCIFIQLVFHAIDQGEPTRLDHIFTDTDGTPNVGMIATLDDDSHASRSPFGRINHPHFVIDQLHFGEVRVRDRQGFSQGVVERIHRSVTFGDNVFTSILAEVPGLADTCVILNGVAKTYAMTGWRVGWMIGPADLIKAATNRQSLSTSNVANVSQRAAIAALEGGLECRGVLI